MRWTYDVSSTEDTIVLTMDNDYTVSADFRVIQKHLTLAIPGGNGTVTKDPDKTSYDINEQVILTAVPGTCCLFKRWSGDISQADPSSRTITLSMNQDRSVQTCFFTVPQLMKFIAAKGNSFQMGSNTIIEYASIPNANDNERPVHSVSFTYNWWMDSTEVTQKHFKGTSKNCAFL